jgi:hypothetical protein
MRRYDLGAGGGPGGTGAGGAAIGGGTGAGYAQYGRRQTHAAPFQTHCPGTSTAPGGGAGAAYGGRAGIGAAGTT